MRRQKQLTSAIGLVRISSRRQEGNTSKETQEREIVQYCEEAGLSLTKIENITESAKDSIDRVEYHGIIQRAIKSGIVNLVFHRFDRETRNFSDAEANEVLVRKGTIILHYAADRKVFDRNTPTSDFLSRDVNVALNKNYCRELSVKVNRAMDAKAESGWYPGNRPPLGYRTQRKLSEDGRESTKGAATIVRDTNERKIQQVLREFELRAAGVSYDEIRKTIIAEGLISPKKTLSYTKSSVQYRLANPFYWGQFEWKKKTYQGKHPIIIPQAHLDAVSRLSGTRGHSIRPRGIFSSWLKCAHPECGCTVIYDPKVKTIVSTGEVKEFRYYHCSNGKRVHETMRGQSLKEDEIWEQFKKPISSITITEEMAADIAKALNETQTKARAATKHQMENFRTALRSLDSQEDELYQDYKKGITPSEESYQRQLRHVRTERLRFTSLLEGAQLQLSDAVAETAKSILELATNAELLWLSKNPDERRKDLDRILSNQSLDGQTIRYEMRKPFQVLSKMKQNEEWWAQLDEFRTACFSYEVA